MKICFIAYSDSIHTRRWVQYFANKPENEVHLLTLVPATQSIPGVVIHQLSGRMLNQLPGKDSVPPALLPTARSALAYVYRNSLTNSMMEKVQGGRLWWELLAIRTFKTAHKARQIILGIKPDLVHGLSISYGGGLGGLIGFRPLVISTWGTDFVYFARKYALYRSLTRKAFSRTDLFFPDNTRDKYLAELYGFDPVNPAHVIPATGGLVLDQFPLFHKNYAKREKLGIPAGTNLIISIRGFKSFHVNTADLIRAIPAVVSEFPNSLFVIDGSYMSPPFLPLKKLVERLGIGEYVRFTDRLDRQGLSDYLDSADIMVSVTRYDGWPISMLEGMAHGVVPVMSCHSPIKEWIIDGRNGYLFDSASVDDIGLALLKALRNKDQYESIRTINWNLLVERADHQKNMAEAEKLYNRLVTEKTWIHSRKA